MNRPDDPLYHNKAAYDKTHQHNNPTDPECGVCMQNSQPAVSERQYPPAKADKNFLRRSQDDIRRTRERHSR